MTNKGSYSPKNMTACPPELRAAMAELGHELKRNRLDVVLAPAPDGYERGRMVRVVQGENPEWYQRLCKQNPSSAKRVNRYWYTKISRYDIARQIHLLATQGWSVSKYAPFLIEEAKKWQRTLLP